MSTEEDKATTSGGLAVLKEKIATPTAPAVLVCRLRHKQLQRGSSPTAGEIELENSSSHVIEIETDRHPLQYLNLVVTDAGGSVLSQGHYGDIFSPRGSIDTLRLTPGARFHHLVSLLETLPQQQRVPGKYNVQAVYEYDGLRAVSEPLAVELPGEAIH